MQHRLLALPLFIVLMGLFSLAMFIPAAHALTGGEFDDARAFLFGGGLSLTLTVMLAVATASMTSKRPARNYLLALLACFILLPAMLALPFYESVGNTRFLNAYFEMVSSLTTTGATVFPGADRLSGSEHLWRALVGWMGGFLIWVTAAAILAPMNLGGFEVLSATEIGQGATAQSGGSGAGIAVVGPIRLRRFTAQLFPVYSALTLALWVMLMLLGDPALVAVSHAMSVLSTSGISPSGGPGAGAPGIAGEAVIFLFLFFAISRQTFTYERPSRGLRRLTDDPEFRMGLLCVTVLPVLLFLRHWIGAYEASDQENLIAGLQALWGGIFTVLSFLSTTGFVSGAWAEARVWSGLETPGLLLMGLALIGGGVATTAGGVKLLRVYALFTHGQRELERLVHPSSVAGSGVQARRIRRHGAYVAWIFFMLFALSIAAVMLALSLTGIDFEPAVVLSVAALSTTGPLGVVAGSEPIAYASLGDAAKLILAGAMVLGRLETLAIIALLNPDSWRS